MPVLPAIGFDDFLSQAQTCDVLLFAGTSDDSEAVEWLTMGPFSHAAMVVVGPHGSKWMWQAAGEAVETDPIKGKKHPGAQLGALRATMLDVVNGYHDAPTYRRLDYDRPVDFDEQVWRAIAVLDGRPFPSLWEMAEDYTKGQFGIDTTSGPMFCSELVAYTFQQVGLLADSPPANSYNPTDFSSDRDEVSLVKGIFVDDQPIDVPPSS